MDTEIENLIRKKEIESMPLDGTVMSFYNKDYTEIYSLFKNSGLLVYPAFTSPIYNYGKAIIVKKDLSNIIARYTSNGNLVVFNNEVLNDSIKVKNINYEQLSLSLKYLMDFFIKIKLIKSYDKSIFRDLNLIMKMQDIDNISYRASKNTDSFLNEFFSKKGSCKNIINCAKSLKICSESAVEQFRMDFFGSFKVNIQPYKNGMRYDFKLARFNANAIIEENNYENIEIVIKKVTKEYLKNIKGVDLELDYIFTDDFFNYYKSLSLILYY